MAKFNYRFVTQFNDLAIVDTAAIASDTRNFQDNDLMSSICDDLGQYPEGLATHSGFFVSVGYAYSQDIESDVRELWCSFVRACWKNVEGVSLLNFQEEIFLEVWSRELNIFHRFTQDDGLHPFALPQYHISTDMESKPKSFLPALASFDETTGLVVGAYNPKGVTNFAYTTVFCLGDLTDSYVRTKVFADGVYMNTSVKWPMEHSGREETFPGSGEYLHPDGSWSRHIAF